MIVIAKYMNGQTIVREVETDSAEEALEKMKEICPRAEEYEVKENG